MTSLDSGASNSSGASTPQPANPSADPETARTLVEVAFPSQANTVFFTALVLGVVLICLPTVFRSSFALDGTQSNLVLCIGAALVLCAFGGQATVQIGRIIMIGAAAVALGLWIFLENYAGDQYLEGTIRSLNLKKYKSVGLMAKNPLIGAEIYNNEHPERSRFNFVVFRKDIDQDTLEVSVEVSDSKKEVVRSVDVAEISWAFGTRRRLEWELRDKDVGGEKVPEIFDVSTNRFISKDILEAARDTHSTSRIGSILIGTALAQATDTIDVNAMLEQLKSDDAVLRRAARDALSKSPIDAIAATMDAFREQYSDYRIRLGVCVALTQRLRADKGQAAAVSEKLTLDDLNRLIDAAGDPDRTIRIYATEFLFDLGDTRAAKLAIGRAATTTDENARYDWLFAAQEGWRKLPNSEKKSLADPLAQAKQKAGDRTLQLFDKLQM
ncbi:MAG: hypothetical protein JOY94_17145 [Methylobacteriaceae bacterium]|nr:hypothetical protein [Methylobacteriaceae bacterium]